MSTRDRLMRLLLVLAFALVPFLAGTQSALAERTAQTPGAKISVTPDEFDIELTRAQPITLSLQDGCAGQTGTLVFKTDDAPGAMARFSVTADFTQAQLWVPIWISIAGFVLAAAVGLIAAHGRWGKEVHVASSWSFKDSWITNVSTLGTVLTTVLAATGFLDAVIPGMATGELVGLSLFFAALVLVAPIMYSATSKWTWEQEPHGNKMLVVRGRCWGVAVAAASTVSGVVGQLATIGLINQAAGGSTGPTTFVFGCLGAAAVALLSYEGVFIRGVTAQPPTEVPDQPAFMRQDISATL